MNILLQKGVKRRVAVPTTDLFDGTGAKARVDTQCLYGETVEILEQKGRFARVRADLDGYEGYVARKDLGLCDTAPTHRIRVPQAIVYAEPCFKDRERAELAMNSQIAVASCQKTSEGEMACIPDLNGWVFLDQLTPVGTHEKDFVVTALMFLTMPYGWGRRSSHIDCSGLLQQALIASGISSPRDCVPQSESPVLGERLDIPPRLYGLERGDLVFWTEKKGRHVVIMVNDRECVHASIAAPRRVRVEPLQKVVSDQLRDGNGRPTVLRRFPQYKQQYLSYLAA